MIIGLFTVQWTTDECCLMQIAQYIIGRSGPTIEHVFFFAIELHVFLLIVMWCCCALQVGLFWFNR